jgi:hypothetical protein
MIRKSLEINYLVVAVAGLVAFVLSVLLHGLFLFGDTCDMDDD